MGIARTAAPTLVGLENHGLNFLDLHEGPNGIVNSDDGGVRAQVLHRDRNRILTASSALDDRDGLRETRACDKLSNFVDGFLGRRNEDAVDQAASIELANRIDEDRSVLSRVRSCLGRSDFMRRPAPAAAMIAVTFMKQQTSAKLPTQAGLPVDRVMMEFHSAGRSSFRGMMNHFAAPLFVTSKDHLARRCLQHAGYRRVDRLSDHLSRVVDNDHRPVIQVSDALIEFLAFLQNEDLHRFARQINRLQRVGKFVDIEHLDAAKLRDLVQIEIVGDDLRFEFLRQFDQLHIDFANRRIVVLDELHGDPRHLLNSLQNIQAAAPAIALQRISGIGNLLEFAKNEVRNQQNAIHETLFRRCPRRGHR